MVISSNSSNELLFEPTFRSLFCYKLFLFAEGVCDLHELLWHKLLRINYHKQQILGVLSKIIRTVES